MLYLLKFQHVMFWFLSSVVALVSYRFVVLGMDEAFAGATHQLLKSKEAFYVHIITAPIALAIAPFQGVKEISCAVNSQTSVDG